jgi:hypothetical protein
MQSIIWGEIVSGKSIARFDLQMSHGVYDLLSMHQLFIQQAMESKSLLNNY